MIEDLMKELADLLEAKKLLERLWGETDVYSRKFHDSDGMSKDLNKDLRKYFKFDDSE